MPFEDTINKATIRQQWDTPILERHFAHIGSPLSYFGLTGPELHDLLDWRESIGTKTAVESVGHTKRQRDEAQDTIGQLLTNIMVHQISSGFQLMRGDVEDVIINGTDSDGCLPQLNDGRSAHLMRFSYDVVNLDFDGGLGYPTKRGVSRRTAAIKKLFERQAGHSFVLFLTINIRDTLGNEIDTYLEELGKRNHGVGWDDLVQWHLSRPNGEREYKLKATVPSFIHAAAEPHMFKSICRPPIVYDGHKQAKLIHFVFELCAQAGNLRSFSDQDDRHLLELPMLRCQNGQLAIAKTSQTKLEDEYIYQYLEFLPVSTKQKILANSRASVIEETNRK